MGADNPDVRAAAVFTLGALIQAHESGGSGGSGASGPPSPSPTSPGIAGDPAVAAAGAAAAAPGAAAAAAAAAAGAEGGPLPEAERLAVERAIACALLEVVYDASPLVRWVRPHRNWVCWC